MTMYETTKSPAAQHQDRTSTADEFDGARPKMLQLCAVDFTVFHFLLPLGRALQNDFEVHFASSDGPYVEAVRLEGFSYHEVPIERSYNLAAHVRAFFVLRKLIARERFDVVHAHTPIAALIGRAAARSARVPVCIYTAHGFYFHDRMRPAVRRFFVFLEWLGGRLTDFTFTQSREDHDAAVEHGVARPERILHIGNGVDLARFDPDRLAHTRQDIRSALGIPADAPVACIVGRLVREKGYFELLDAFARVIEEVPDAHLVAVGGALDSDYDDASAQIKKRAAQFGAQRVHLLSFRDDVEIILGASDLFVLPSHREGMPRSLIEAMAMGLPSVVTDIRGSREAIEDGRTGRIVPVGDARRLADAIIELLGTADLRERFGAAARRTAQERFDEATVIARQAQVVQGLCQQKGVPAGTRVPRGGPDPA